MTPTLTAAALPSDLPILHDPAVPARDLLGEDAGALISALLEPAGAAARTFRPTQSTYYPGRSLTVAHQVEVEWADGRSTTETVVLSSGRRTPKGALIFTDGDHEVLAWRFPHDPWLPGLAPVMDPRSLTALLADLGLNVEDPRTKVRAYRPGRRAVVEVTGSGVRVFLKVVTPRSVEALQRSHVELSGRAPVPQSLGWSPDHGVVVLEAVPGRTMRDALFAGAPLPGPDVLLAVLDSLAPHEEPGEVTEVPVDWRAQEFASVIGSVMPELAEPTRRLADQITPFALLASRDPVVPSHGDFYEAQLLVDDDSVTGLLDVDTYGPGRRVEDLATMIGHLSVLALGSTDRAGLERYAAHLLEGFDRVVDPAVLRGAVAAVVLGLATGSFRVMDPGWRRHTADRVALAGEWVASAQRVSAAGTPTLHVSEAEKSLSFTSPSPQT